MYVLMKSSTEFMSHDYCYAILASRNKKMLDSLAFRLSKISNDDYHVDFVAGISKKATEIEYISDHDSDWNYAYMHDIEFREKLETSKQLESKLKKLHKEGSEQAFIGSMPILNEITHEHILHLFNEAEASLGKRIESMRDIYTLEKGLKKRFKKKKDSRYYHDFTFKYRADFYMGFDLGFLD